MYGGFMLDMIRRLSEDRKAYRLQKERLQEKNARMRDTGKRLHLPDTTPEEISKIIRETRKKQIEDTRYFMRRFFISIALTIAVALLLWLIL